ncbi:MAG: ATP-binding cassette domain-containing protein [Idiomarina sp.]|nr:ATP-binding cassette domain-containing protein [Idiomarina sp.]
MLALHQVRISRQGQLLIDLPLVEIAAGEVLTLMGPSGSGKSTLLNWIVGAPLSGFECEGEVILNDTLVNGLAAEHRHIGLRFQDPWLFPHMSVLENLLFALPRDNTMKRSARQQHALSFLRALQLDDLSMRMPNSLSGGQAARVSLARALINEPQAMLLDEPFSALDMTTRETVRNWTFTHLKARNIATILVTHDAADAPPGGDIIRL